VLRAACTKNATYKDSSDVYFRQLLIESPTFNPITEASAMC